MTSNRPNILFIQADQLKPQVLPGYGGTAVTPHLDRLCAEGVVFENAYCNFPLCAPSRFSMHGRDAAVARAGIRQRRGALRRHPHRGALHAARRLSHHAVRQAALRRPGHAARVSRTAGAGALSDRLPLDGELGRGPHGLEQRLERRHPVRYLRTQHADGPRRDGALPGGVQAARFLARTGPAAVLSAGVFHPPPRAVLRSCASTGSAIATKTSRCPGPRCCRSRSAISSSTAHARPPWPARRGHHAGARPYRPPRLPRQTARTSTRWSEGCSIPWR